MKSFTYVALFVFSLLFMTSAKADRVYTDAAVCLKYGQYTVGRVVTWHSPLLSTPNSYSDKGVKMKIRGLYPRESDWADAPTFTRYPSYIAWNYVSSGTRPQSVAGLHRGRLALTGAMVGVSPTFSRCYGV